MSLRLRIDETTGCKSLLHRESSCDDAHEERYQRLPITQSSGHERLLSFDIGHKTQPLMRTSLVSGKGNNLLFTLDATGSRIIERPTPNRRPDGRAGSECPGRRQRAGEDQGVGGRGMVRTAIGCWALSRI